MTISPIDGTASVAVRAGAPGVTGFVAGAGATARLKNPGAMAFLPGPNVTIFMDQDDCVLRALWESTIMDLAGDGLCGAATDDFGVDAKFATGTGKSIAVSPAGVVYISQGVDIRRYVYATGFLDTLTNPAPAPIVALGIMSVTGRIVLALNDKTVYLRTPAAAAVFLVGTASSTTSADGTGAAATFRSTASAVLGLPNTDDVLIVDNCAGSASFVRVTSAGVAATVAGAGAGATCAVVLTGAAADGVATGAQVGSITGALTVFEACSAFRSFLAVGSWSPQCAGSFSGTIAPAFIVAGGKMTLTGTTRFTTSLTIAAGAELVIANSSSVIVATDLTIFGKLTVAGGAVEVARALKIDARGTVQFMYGLTNTLHATGSVQPAGFCVLVVPQGQSVPDGFTTAFMQWEGTTVLPWTTPAGWVNLETGPSAIAFGSRQMEITCSDQSRFCAGTASRVRTVLAPSTDDKLVIGISVISSLMFLFLLCSVAFWFRLYRRGFGPSLFARMEELEIKRIEQISAKRRRTVRSDDDEALHTSDSSS